jgi:hypothetical protein
MPSNVFDPAGASGRPIDNGKAGRARELRTIERGCQHLAGGRKLWAGGSSRIYTIPANTTKTIELRIAREVYTANVTVHLLYQLNASAGLEGTLSVQTAYETQTTDIPPTGAATPGNLGSVVQPVALAASPAAGDLGTFDFTVQITAQSGAPITVYYLGVEAMASPSITV